MMSSSLSQPNSIVSGSTSGGTDIEQITSCLCPTVFWSKPLGCRIIFGDVPVSSIKEYQLIISQ